MKLFGVLIAVSLVTTAVCASCTDKAECGTQCPDGYHAQCIQSECKCPAHSCSTTTKCPQGAGQGCPPFCTTMCQNNLCICKWPGSRTKTGKH